jgi:hypothetical protein
MSRWAIDCAYCKVLFRCSICYYGGLNVTCYIFFFFKVFNIVFDYDSTTSTSRVSRMNSVVGSVFWNLMNDSLVKFVSTIRHMSMFSVHRITCSSCWCCSNPFAFHSIIRRESLMIISNFEIALNFLSRKSWSFSICIICTNMLSVLVDYLGNWLTTEVEVTLRLTVSQSVSMSWYRVPLWDLRPDIISCPNVAIWNLRSCIYWAPSLTRGRVFNLQCNHSIVRVAQNPKPYFTVSSETPPTWRSEVTLRLTVCQ